MPWRYPRETDGNSGPVKIVGDLLFSTGKRVQKLLVDIHLLEDSVHQKVRFLTIQPTVPAFPVRLGFTTGAAFGSGFAKLALPMPRGGTTSEVIMSTYLKNEQNLRVVATPRSIP